MKTTTRLYDVIRPAFINYKNANKGNAQIMNYTTFNDNFMVELAVESETMTNLLKYNVYQGLFSILSDKVGEKFMYEFTQRFLNRTIKFQTIDLFKLHFFAEVKARKAIIEGVYGNDENLIQGVETTKTVSDSKGTNNGTATSSSLPQAMTNIDNVDFADSLDQNENKDESHSEQTGINSSHSIKNVQDFSQMKVELFTQLDRKLFSQIF